MTWPPVTVVASGVCSRTVLVSGHPLKAGHDGVTGLTLSHLRRPTLVSSTPAGHSGRPAVPATLGVSCCRDSRQGTCWDTQPGEGRRCWRARWRVVSPLRGPSQALPL